MIKIIGHKRYQRNASREARFQTWLRQAFRSMNHDPNNPIIPGERHGLLTAFVIKRPAGPREFDKLYRWDTWKRLPSIPGSPFRHKQVYETIKNTVAHGGDAIVVARQSLAYRRGVRRRVLEFVIWDNGPGIKNIEEALEQGVSNYLFVEEPYHKLCGAGKGMDTITAFKPNTFAAHELIVESRNNQVYRGSKTDEYHARKTRTFVPGTRVTIRFWY